VFDDVRRRLILAYAGVIAATLLLLGPVLYLSFARQLSDAADATLRLAAQRQALLALVPGGVTLGTNPAFTGPPPLANQEFFYLLLSPDGRLQDSSTGVQHAGLPDVTAARRAARLRRGVFSTLVTADAGDIRLYTAVIKRGGLVAALLQAGQPAAPLVDAQHRLLYLLLGLGAAAVAIATAGGVVLTRQAIRPLHAAFTAQRQFIADASHELRTPLTLMRTNAEVLLETGGVPDPDDRALVADVVVEAEHMGRIIADLLTLARLDAGALTLARDPVALAPLIAATTRQVARLAARADVEVRQGDTAPLLVWGDAGRLEQALLILLDNAVKYNRPGGVVEVTLRRASGQAALAVRDTGRGIPADQLPRLFARFHRAPGTAARTEGSGLGLAIAQGIVQAHHGRLLARSTVGEGSVFTALLPLASAGETGPPITPAPTMNGASSAPRVPPLDGQGD